jgi:hypothetical protein
MQKSLDLPDELRSVVEYVKSRTAPAVVPFLTDGEHTLSTVQSRVLRVEVERPPKKPKQ